MLGAAAGMSAFAFLSPLRALAADDRGDDEPQRSTVVGIVRTPRGGGFWLLTADGQVIPNGDAVGFNPQPTPPAQPVPFVGLATTPTGQGLWLLNKNGDVVAVGDARI